MRSSRYKMQQLFQQSKNSVASMSRYLPSLGELSASIATLAKKIPRALQAIYDGCSQQEKALFLNQLAQFMVLRGGAFVVENPGLTMMLFAFYRLVPQVAADTVLVTWTAYNNYYCKYVDVSASRDCRYMPPTSPHYESDCFRFELKCNATLVSGGIIANTKSDGNLIANYGMPCYNQSVYLNFLRNYSSTNLDWEGDYECALQRNVPDNASNFFSITSVIGGTTQALCAEFVNYFDSLVIPCIKQLYYEQQNTNPSDQADYTNRVLNVMVICLVLGGLVSCSVFSWLMFRRFRRENENARAHALLEPFLPRDVGLRRNHEQVVVELAPDHGPNGQCLQALQTSILSKLDNLKNGIECVKIENAARIAAKLERQFSSLKDEFQSQLIRFYMAYGITVQQEGSIWKAPLDKPVRVVFDDGTLSEQVYEQGALEDYFEQQPAADRADPVSNRLAQIEIRDGIERVKVRDVVIENPVILLVSEKPGEPEEEGIFDSKHVARVHPLTGCTIVKKPIERSRLASCLLKNELQSFMDKYIDRFKNLETEINTALKGKMQSEQKGEASPNDSPVSSPRLKR